MLGNSNNNRNRDSSNGNNNNNNNKVLRFLESLISNNSNSTIVIRVSWSIKIIGIVLELLLLHQSQNEQRGLLQIKAKE